ncbi:amino acid ABC transporter permease [Salipiger mucosus]|uniref:Putative inner membrane component of binding protein-protein-dependent transport system n=1 Tax=Salipiger mucosus DSM 16094 TaxID=1123237 RepID=S9QQE3_9RHOB|nr:amino acid ABC transporter permease [Salipiger mucosus]EPX81863.1 putative inner membrane component of binding protein-protein-dependent transport system [Salipiger mucosus DSM 16094]
MDFDLSIWAVRGPYILQGLWLTLALVAGVLAISTPLALAVGLALEARSRWLRAPATVLSWMVRGVPPLIILFIAYYVLPIVLDLRLESLTAAIAGFVVYNTFILGEVVSAGLRAVPKGQHEAIAAAGLPMTRSLRRIVLPQAMPSIIPPYVSYSMDMVKGTALAGAIGVTELVTRANQAIVATNRPFEILLGVAIIYGVIDAMLIAVQMWSERRWDHQGHVSP